MASTSAPLRRRFGVPSTASTIVDLWRSCAAALTFSGPTATSGVTGGGALNVNMSVGSVGAGAGSPGGGVGVGAGWVIATLSVRRDIASRRLLAPGLGVVFDRPPRRHRATLRLGEDRRLVVAVLAFADTLGRLSHR